MVDDWVSAVSPSMDRATDQTAGPSSARAPLMMLLLLLLTCVLLAFLTALPSATAASTGFSRFFLLFSLGRSILLYCGVGVRGQT